MVPILYLVTYRLFYNYNQVDYYQVHHLKNQAKSVCNLVDTPKFVVQHYTWSKCEQFYLQMDQCTRLLYHITRIQDRHHDSSCVIDLLRALYAHCTTHLDQLQRTGEVQQRLTSCACKLGRTANAWSKCEQFLFTGRPTLD